MVPYTLIQRTLSLYTDPKPQKRTETFRARSLPYRSRNEPYLSVFHFEIIQQNISHLHIVL